MPTFFLQALNTMTKKDKLLHLSYHFSLFLKEKSKVFKYAKWPLQWLTNESLVWYLVK